MRYNSNIKGVWYQYIQKFGVARLKASAHDVTFTVTAGDVITGVAWEYKRLSNKTLHDAVQWMASNLE